MRYLAALCLLVLLALATGCGREGVSAEGVVRAWTDAVNADDAERAGELFAPGARVVQRGAGRVLRTRADAVEWNAARPCGMRIVSIRATGDRVRASFRLTNRELRRCADRGGSAGALFEIRDSKIVLWHELDAAGEQASPASVA